MKDIEYNYMELCSTLQHNRTKYFVEGYAAKVHIIS